MYDYFIGSYLCSSMCPSICSRVVALNLQYLQVCATSVCWCTVRWKNEGMISSMLSWLETTSEVFLWRPSADRLWNFKTLAGIFCRPDILAGIVVMEDVFEVSSVARLIAASTDTAGSTLDAWATVIVWLRVEALCVELLATVSWLVWGRLLQRKFDVMFYKEETVGATEPRETMEWCIDVKINAVIFGRH